MSCRHQSMDTCKPGFVIITANWLAVNPSLCLLNDDSGLCINSMQKRMLFAGFTAAKKTIIQNWFTPHMCRKTYWIRSLLQIVSLNVQWRELVGPGLRPLMLGSVFWWITWLYRSDFCVFVVLPSPSLDWTLRCWVCVCCFVLLYSGCYVVLCVKKNKNKKLLITKKKTDISVLFQFMKTVMPCACILHVQSIRT